MFTSLKQFYNSKEYEHLREQVIDARTDKDTEIIYCEECGKPIINAYDLITHHRKELTESNVNDWNISLNPEMIKVLCFKCHNIVHRRFGQEGKRNVYLVYGAPCSGKSTFVKENASPNDLILDIDNIWQMITINNRFEKPERLKTNVFAIRDCIMEQIRYRNGKWENAYVIGTYPFCRDRERVVKDLNARTVFIQASKEDCITRATQRFYSDSQVERWCKYIKEWFENYDGG